jgi:hypothetical protein
VSETDRPGSEIERVASRGLAPLEGAPGDEWSGDAGPDREPGAGYVDDQDFDEGPGVDWAKQFTTLRQHKVALACAALTVVQLIWKAAFISRYFFHQDDFQVLDVARKSGLSWQYLTHVDSGHLFPGVYAIAWVLARTALYNWAVASGVILVMIAGASVSAWWLLRTLLGDRPAILIPFTLYLCSALPFGMTTWWITGAEALPLQIALFMALSSHVRYARTGELRHAVRSAAWVFFGLLFFEKSVFIPLVLFAVTAGYLTRRRRLMSAVAVTAVRHRKAWFIYLGLLAGYGIVLVTALHTSATKAAAPSSGQAFYSFTSRLLTDTLLPGLLGGPWRWYHPVNSVGAYAYPPTGLIWLAAIVILAIIAASILTRPVAWRAWAVLVGWVVLADILPVAIGRLNIPGYAALFGMETRYVADVPAVLAIVVALAFWPVAGLAQDEPAPARQKEFFTGRWRAVAIAVVAVCVLGSVWSVQRFQTLTTRFTSAVTPVQTYIANARAALVQAPAGTVIVSQPVPGSVMESLFGHYAATQVVLGPLVPSSAQMGWTVLPSGQIGQLKVFGPDGRLWPAAIDGSTTQSLPFLKSCLTPKRKRLVLQFPAATWAQDLKDTYVLRLGYVTSAGSAGSIVTVTYGKYVHQFTIRSGVSKAYFTVWGAAQDVELQANLSQGGICFAPAVAGTVGVFPGSPIPSTSS